jgi:hypothetical protein
MITGRATTKIDAYELFELMEEVYGINRDTSLFLLFGEGAESGSMQNATATAKADHVPLTKKDLVYPRPPGGRWINATDILTDLCIRGEIAPGEYVIEIFW